MLKTHDFFQNFQQFISSSKSGKRLKKDGSRIRTGTIRQYEAALVELKRFCDKENFKLEIKDVRKANMREIKSTQIYWKRFYQRYTNYHYSKGSFDNSTGTQIKIIKTFFSYLKTDKGIFTGDFHKGFYVRKENIPILVLAPEQLQFLIGDKTFENSLPDFLKRTKDFFVFGCTVGLRVSDLMKLTKKNIQQTVHGTFLFVRSIKTGTDTKIKLPDYCLEILLRNRKNKFLLPVLSQGRLNHNIKTLCEKAGWVYEVEKTRERLGITRTIKNNGKCFRFCDLVTTHTMRRTAITTLLSFGMSESMVRRISGHAAGSKEFYRYVNYEQKLIDKVTDRIFDMMNQRKHTEEKLVEIS